jgi:Holliday junction resolvase
MGRPRHPKPDSVQRDLVRDLGALGWLVWDLSPLGGEVLDLLVMRNGVCLPVEVKSPGGKLTRAQRRSIARLRAVGVEPIVAGTAEEVVEAWPE